MQIEEDGGMTLEEARDWARASLPHWHLSEEPGGKMPVCPECAGARAALALLGRVEEVVKILRFPENHPDWGAGTPIRDALDYLADKLEGKE